MKLCKDCKHFGGTSFWSIITDRHRRCFHPNAFNEIDVITGEKTRLIEFASNLRKFENHCGMDAKWFEPKRK